MRDDCDHGRDTLLRDAHGWLADIETATMHVVAALRSSVALSLEVRSVHRSTPAGHQRAARLACGGSRAVERVGRSKGPAAMEPDFARLPGAAARGA